MIGYLLACAGGCLIGLAVACVFVGWVREYFEIPEGPEPGRLRW